MLCFHGSGPREGCARGLLGPVENCGFGGLVVRSFPQGLRCGFGVLWWVFVLVVCFGARWGPWLDGVMSDLGSVAGAGRTEVVVLEGLEPGVVHALPIPGAWVFIPRVFEDDRGSFHEWFRGEQFTEQLGYPFQVVQANCSYSRRGVVRGIHVADVPPGQAKLVTCLAGSVRDVLVDLREGSPTFGRSIAVELGMPGGDVSAAGCAVVHVPIGVGHGFAAKSDVAVVAYLVSEAYNPQAEWEVYPFDPELAVDWGVGAGEALLSAKDQAAPRLQEVRGRLPQFREARGWEQELQREWQLAMDASEGDWE